MKKDNFKLMLCLLLLICSVISWNKADTARNETMELCEANKKEINNAVNELKHAEQSISNQIEYLDCIYQTAEKYGIEPELALAMMKVESNFNTKAENGNCKGLLQVSTIHTTADLFDLRTNVETSFSYLSDLKEDRDDLHEILGCYNRGERGYSEYVKRTNQVATDYSNKIIKLTEELKGEQNV